MLKMVEMIEWTEKQKQQQRPRAARRKKGAAAAIARATAALMICANECRRSIASYWLADAAAPGSRSAALCVNLLMRRSRGCISVLVTSSNSLMK